MTIKGKTDPAAVALMMWLDDELPEFHPVRHLLACLKFCGITDVYFSPDYNYLYHEIVKNPAWDDNFTGI